MPAARADSRPLASALRAAAFVAALAVVLLAGREAAGAVARFAAWVDGLGAWGPVVFMAGYVIATVAFVPGSLLTLAAGALFGLVRGTAYVFAAATLGATAAFLVARHLARGAVERRLARVPRFAAVDRAVGRDGFRTTLLLRLSPLFPFNLLNYALGLTRVSLRDYLLASVGMLPGTVLYVYYGTVVRSVAALGRGERPRSAAEYVLLGVGLAATVLVVVLVGRRARRALDAATAAADAEAEAGDAR